ncbi:BatA domain-containing protein [Zhouia sp. PK063]|uniref:BatA domain-containing protein n=1 Tax=Zhouia sp. PK063 TaxID=3373602 RepID=UPI00378A4464
MHFKSPEVLWALLLLIIPILVHLFQLRKFKKVAFTNVKFLKQVVQQTRKSSQLKKWLVLFCRLFIITAIVFAFAQPYLGNKENANKKITSVIYLDNSFSMQARGSKGELLQRAIQDLITNFQENDSVTIFTNNETYANTTIKNIQNDLLHIKYTSNNLSTKEIYLKARSFFKNSKNDHQLYLISDFQKNNNVFEVIKDSSFTTNYIQLQPEKIDNLSIDSAWISNENLDFINLHVQLSSSTSIEKQVSVSVFNQKQIIAKASASFTKDTLQSQIVFNLPTNQNIKGKVVINDDNLNYDNTLYFSVNKPKKINLLSINNAEDDFLKRIFSNDEFNYKSTAIDSLDYNLISSQQIIILNEVLEISNTLATSLQQFTQQGGILVIIPSAKNEHINSLLKPITNLSLKQPTVAENLISTLHFDHPLYKNTFNGKVNNFQYPKVAISYPVSGNYNDILSYQNQQPFLLYKNQVYLFTAPFTKSNFKSSTLIVPTLYNIGKTALKNAPLYFKIDDTNTFDVAVNLNTDEVLSMATKAENFIPLQQVFAKKVHITTTSAPEIANNYELVYKNDSLKTLSYNYKRTESNLQYLNFQTLPKVNYSTQLPQAIQRVKIGNEMNALWKWFVIFAMVFLCIEMLILKYFK